ncbi:class I SAM-dependent methyltransferase [Qipengyuania sp. S6317L1]|uniref:class I SAM-dependent methyltransferase n=1 Tax=Qipengyuania sp. S6317L1 TaxID=2926410 RepID=UPI001FF59C35|nr:class I SAM-dependent methyltransferase [Qipengyuania sp. S6317L1]MCK0097868.1 class I SAM-dependent methyltransferase [Qipengyuania sp. S6317L1]
MSELLIHSMAEFSSLIIPCLEHAKVANVAEIGSEFGGMSKLLAQHTAAAGGTLTCIDPEPADGFAPWASEQSHVRHVPLPSLEALAGEVGEVDAWFVDGDHNYYTVYHELVGIDAAQRASGKPLLAFMHDVSWPCARRDFYYAPERVPPGWRHPHSFDHGVRLGEDGVLAGRGLRGMGSFAVALQAGGERNGVLTAVEDFLKEADAEERPLFYVHVPAVLGLGIIFDAQAEWSGALAEFLLPFHANPLIARLEENRLRNWLEVVDWQDRSGS